MLTIQDSLPTAVVGKIGDTISFADMLKQSFGTSQPSGFQSYTLSNLYQNLPNGTGNDIETSFWGSGSGAQNSYWLLNGQKITSPQTIDASQIGSVKLVIGNSMLNTAAFSVTVTGAQADAPLSRTYNVWTAQPAVQGNAFGTGTVNPADIVTSTQAFGTVYPNIKNENNCNWIADDIAAAAGAVMPYANYSDFPEQNVSGGFWRAVYRGDETANPVSNWSTLTQPGDVVRMVWGPSGGHHTTTVTGTVQADGTLPVFDNDTGYVAGHDASYWNNTVPQNVTIYRLDPNHQYLIEGTQSAEFLQGTVYNDLFHTQGGGDTVVGGLGNDEIQTDESTDDGNLLMGNEGNDLFLVRSSMDTVFGGQGDDSITAYQGDNILYGNAGSDTITTLVGDNTIVGGNGSMDGADVIKAGSGNDLIFGNGGADTVSGGYGADTIWGGSGNDVLSGNQGDDVLAGNGGNDFLFGGLGNDTLYGGKGNDTLVGGGGNDLLFGNEGANLFTFANGTTDFISGAGTGDTIGDFKSGTDTLLFDAGPAGTSSNFAASSKTSNSFATIQQAAQTLINAGATYAFVSDQTDGFLFTALAGGGSTTITDAVKLAGVTTMRASDIA